MSSPNCAKIGEICFIAFLFDGRFSVAVAKKACCSSMVSHIKNRIAFARREDWLLTMNEPPAPPHIFIGCKFVIFGGIMAPYSSLGFIPLYTLTPQEPLKDR